MKKASLPAWANAIGPGVIEVDASGFYTEILTELQVDAEKYNQYWLEMAKAIMKWDIRAALFGTELAPKGGKALRVIINDTTKAENKGVSVWAQARFPAGKGVVLGAKEARDHYRRLRGFVPA